MTFEASLARLACLSDDDLATVWMFRGTPMDLRYALFHALEEEQRAVIKAPRAPSEAARILSLAQSAFGDLRGLMAGIDDGLLDRAPSAGEWSLRETLAHLIGAERTYRANTQHSIARRAEEPILMAAERRPQPDPLDTSGGVQDILARFAARRAESDLALANVADADLARPTMWGGAEVDVRHRVHRFASHLVEHTYQCEKAIRAQGAYGGDARAVARRVGAMRGLHERRSDAATVRALDAALAEKARAAPG